MLKVGITGGIGSGKSVVCRILSILNVPVYDADNRAKILMNSNQHLITQVKTEFGEEAYLSNGELNRTVLAGKVFDNPEKLEKLNSFVHPAVREDFHAWSKLQASKYVVKEAALLIETGSYKELDKLILVKAPYSIKLERILRRDDHRNEDQVKSIMERQMKDEEKEKCADFIINNDESHPILSQVLQIHAELEQKALH